MRVLLLCAGFGTRMRPVTDYTPKPLLPVGNRPALDYLVDSLREAPDLEGVTVVSNGKYLDSFRDWAAVHRDRGLSVEVLNDGAQREDERLGAVGDLVYALDRLPVDGTDLVVAGGDNIFLFELLPVLSVFREMKESAVLALREPDLAKRRRTGVLELAADGRVIALHEKPEIPCSEWICPPFYGFKPEVIPHIRAYAASGAPGDAIGSLISFLVKKSPFRAVKSDGGRYDIGSPEGYLAATQARWD